MEDKTEYLVQDKTKRVYIRTDALAKRKDMRPCAGPKAAQDQTDEADKLKARLAEIPPRQEGQSLKAYLVTLQNRQIADYMLASFGVTVAPGKKDEMIAKAVEAVGEAA